MAEYRKEHYDAVKDATRHKKSRDSRKKWLRDYKENLKCELCGENHPATLDFHHLNKDTKKNNINRMIKSSSIESIKEEIKLCQVLCSNCHRKLHWDDNIPQN